MTCSDVRAPVLLIISGLSVTETGFTMSNQLRAADLLRQAAAELVASCRSGGSAPPATVARPSPTTVAPTSNAMQELRSCFAPYGAQNRRLGRRGQGSRPAAQIILPMTWTHKFCLLSDPSDENVPTRDEKIELNAADLGEKKITIPKDSNPCTLKDVIEKSYPKLVRCGGFELLRKDLTGTYNLIPIRAPASGYTSKYLANESGLNQAVCYIRPIQKSLSLSPIEGVQPSDECPREECLQCLQTVPIILMREHLQSCLGKVAEESVTDQESVVDEVSAVGEQSAVGEEPVIDLISDSNEPDVRQPFDLHLEQSVRYTIETMTGVIDPHIIVAKFCDKFMRGRSLDLDIDNSMDGEAFSIFITRDNMFMDGVAEIQREGDLSLPVDVTFIGEEAQDLGGPRREFFSSVVRCIKDKLTNQGELMTEDLLGPETYLRYLRDGVFYAAGVLSALSVIQGGPTPAFLSPSACYDVVFQPTTKIEQEFNRGLGKVGFVELCKAIPSVSSVFEIKEDVPITYPMLIKLLKPVFSPEGSNARHRENAIYRIFLDYDKEVAAHRRGTITMGHILKFVTGLEDIPALGFKTEPSIGFMGTDSWIPTASTCLCKLYLARRIVTEPEKDVCFNLFDYAFVNDYFGFV